MDHTHRKNGGAALDIFPRTKRGGPENFRKQIQPGIDTPGVGPPNGDPPGVWSPGVGPPGIIGVATWEWDMVTGVCRYSPEWDDIMGPGSSDSPSPYNWSWWSGRMHMDDMPLVLAVNRKFYEGKIEQSEVVYRVRRQDGRWVRLLTRGVVSGWKDDGTPSRMTGISLDISHLDMLPPLPDDTKAPPPFRERRRYVCAGDRTAELQTGQTGSPRYLSEECGTRKRSMLNERRLNALYQLTQMEKAPEDEVLHFALTSVLQLTGSMGGFLHVPDPDPHGKGQFYWCLEHTTNIGGKNLSSEGLPVELAEAITQIALSPTGLICNGTDGKPLYTFRNGALPVTRYLLAPGMEGERMVCLAGVCNKPEDYDESDLQQVETLINAAWLILRRQRHMRELERAKEAAESANKAKNEFLANVSHELRTPLHGVLSMLQLLSPTRLDSEQREFLDAAQTSGSALMHIISDILDFSKMESGKMRLTCEPFDFKASIISSLRIFHEKAESIGLAFTIEMDPAIPDVLLGDDTRVRQIMFNLVGNALKFTAKGHIAVDCALLPTSRKGTAAIRLTVADSGIGIPEDKQGKLFTAFTQADGFSGKKYPGTGLGLSITRRLVEMMGGEISLESEPGRGTTVVCSVFLSVPAAPVVEQAIFAAGTEAIDARPLDILVAEDDAVGRFAIKSFLRQAGHRPLCVPNGRHALEALQLHPFHCLLTDIQMPDMDGLEIAKHIHEGKVGEFHPSEEVRALIREVYPEAKGVIREVDPGMIIVAVSAHSMVGDRERFLQQGINHYISKPIVVNELHEVLRKIRLDVRR